MQPGSLLVGTPHDEVKRFSTRRKPIEFYVDDDLFIGVPALPATSALELTKMHGELQEAEGARKLDVILQVFSQFLEDASYRRFADRLADKSNPIDLSTLMEVIQWLLGEAYGLRPTRKPSPSDTAPSDSGPASTDGAPPEMLTPEISSGVDSST